MIIAKIEMVDFFCNREILSNWPPCSANLYLNKSIQVCQPLFCPFLLSLHCLWSPDLLSLCCCLGSCSDLRGAVEEVLPSLRQQSVGVFILSEHCDVEGIESLSDKIQQASDEPLSPQLRANIHYRSPALYIYTSGTTGDPVFPFHLCSASVFNDKALSCKIRTIKILCL